MIDAREKGGSENSIGVEGDIHTKSQRDEILSLTKKKDFFGAG